MFYAGRSLQNEFIFQDYDTEKNSSIIIILWLRGGFPRYNNPMGLVSFKDVGKK